jgi:hypothetical protein
MLSGLEGAVADASVRGLMPMWCLEWGDVIVIAGYAPVAARNRRAATSSHWSM